MNILTYPSDHMNITQSYVGSFSHQGNFTGIPQEFPIDEAGKDGGRCWFLCPCDEMVIKRIYGTGGRGTNTIWLESISEVATPTFYDYVNIMVIHPEDDDLLKLKVGQTFKRGEKIFREGKNGNATGNHHHLSIARGKFQGNGWVINSKGKWVINGNAQKPEDCFFINGTQVINSRGLNFIEYKEDESMIVVEKIEGKLTALTDRVRMRIEPSIRSNETIKGLLPIGEYNVARMTENDGHTWVKVNNLWVALIEGATEFKEEKCEDIKELEIIIEKLKEENEVLKQQLKTLQDERNKYDKIEVLVRR